MGALLALTLFGTFWGALIGIVLFLIICWLADIYENGFFATAALIVICVLFYYKGANFAPFMFIISWTFAGTYLGIGLVYSVIRVFFEGRKLGKKIQDLPKGNTSQKDYVIDKLSGNVSRWWFMWPISLINWVLTDLLRDFWDYVYSKMGNFYRKVLELGIKSVK